MAWLRQLVWLAVRDCMSSFLLNVFCLPQTAHFSYAPVVGLYTCLPCETGKFASLYHSSSCSSCTEGSANPLTGQGSSVLVLKSTTEINKNSFSRMCELPAWLLCRDERFSLSLRSDLVLPRCHQLPPLCRGKVHCTQQNHSMYDEIKTAGEIHFIGPSCPPGTFSNETGMSFCDDCVPGYIAGLASSTTCEPCSIGFFSSVYRGSECVKCSKGTANALLGQTECADCDLGRYSAVAGHSKTKLLGPHLYLAATVCGECVPGKYAREKRSVACMHPRDRKRYLYSTPTPTRRNTSRRFVPRWRLPSRLLRKYPRCSGLYCL